MPKESEYLFRIDRIQFRIDSYKIIDKKTRNDFFN